MLKFPTTSIRGNLAILSLCIRPGRTTYATLCIKCRAVTIFRTRLASISIVGVNVVSTWTNCNLNLNIQI